jgi:hypothetical protein
MAISTRGIELYLDIGVGYFNMLFIKNEYTVNETRQREEKGEVAQILLNK